MSGRIEAERIQTLNERGPDPRGRAILYWMDHSLRDQHNHALEYAIDRANAAGLPLVTVIALDPGYPDHNRRHLQFIAEGIVELSRKLRKRRVGLTVRHGAAPQVVRKVADELRPAEVVTDRGYLRHHRRWRRELAETLPLCLTQVESDLVVPVEVVSNKQEFAARTIRPKLHRSLESFLKGLEMRDAKQNGSPHAPEGLPTEKPDDLLNGLELDESAGPVSELFRGGPDEAERVLEVFVTQKAEGYAGNRNRAEVDGTSTLSPYLHYGMISPIRLIQRAQDSLSKEDAEAFIEELFIRRELAHNYVYYQPHYDSLAALPDWARKTMSEHAADERPVEYSMEELEQSLTEDPYWNAAMKEMRETGYMHNYMRMYWGKKILEWSPGYEEALDRALTLNNRYFLDGRDANSYASNLWIYGLHDRAWQENPVFGKLRIMKQSGLKRKLDPEGYVTRVNRTAARIASSDGTR